MDYFSDIKLLDSQNSEILHEMPINYIMRIFGYDSLLADDPFNNSWGRCCIYFRYSNYINLSNVIIEGPHSRA